MVVLFCNLCFFYAYQGAPAGIGILDPLMKALDIGIHQGDWKPIDIHLKKQDENYMSDHVFYARHQQIKGNLVKAADIKKANDNMKEDKNATHPIVYVALNSHASYPKHNLISKDFDRTSSTGPLWPCWRNVKYVGTLDKPQPGQE